MLTILFYKVNPAELAAFILEAKKVDALKWHEHIATAKNIAQIRSAGFDCKPYSDEVEFDVFVTSTSDNEYSVYPTNEDMAVYEGVLSNGKVFIVPPLELLNFLLSEEGADDQIRFEREYFEMCVSRAKVDGILCAP